MRLGSSPCAPFVDLVSFIFIFTGVAAIVFDEIDFLAQEDASRRLAARPFDLMSGPLVRAVMVTWREASGATLLLCLHHSITDGTSNTIIASDVAAGTPRAGYRVYVCRAWQHYHSSWHHHRNALRMAQNP